ncbi:hypothetical protein ALC62_07899 [Cyphomyrmex costatus]|uniref:Uncharacterized protein n=1 Tax=Cyphomyrmex costatus TaxID=456900 RepID=A0A195CKM6_9HYME|nr:hypothetical protein ALC62_07899 [Cyphomyrmex costatus]
MGISMRWASREKRTEWRGGGGGGGGGGRGGGAGVRRSWGELQSRSLTWGARVMFKRQFWHPADPGPHLLQPRRRRDTPTLRSAVPPFCDPYVPLSRGLLRLLLTDRTKLASPVPPKPRNCTNTLRDSGDGGVAPCGCSENRITRVITILISRGMIGRDVNARCGAKVGDGTESKPPVAAKPPR